MLPGPLGLVLYPLALRAARTWEHCVEPDERDFGWFAARAFHVIDWIPQRVTRVHVRGGRQFRGRAVLLALAGRAVAAARGGHRARERRGRARRAPGRADPRGGAFVDRPALGTGEPAREDALASLEGLLWRALVVWLIVFLLAAALQLA